MNKNNTEKNIKEQNEAAEKNSRAQTITGIIICIVMIGLWSFGIYGAIIKSVLFSATGLGTFMLCVLALYIWKKYKEKRAEIKSAIDPDAKENIGTVSAIAVYQGFIVFFKKNNTYKVWVNVGGTQAIGYSQNKNLKKGDTVKIMWNPQKPATCKIL